MSNSEREISRRMVLAGLSVAGAAGVLGASERLATAKAANIRWAQGWLLWRDVKGETLKGAIDALHAVGADGIEYSPREGEPEKWGFTRESLLAYLSERNMRVSGMYFGNNISDPARKGEIVVAAVKRITLVKAFNAKDMVIGPPSPPATAKTPAERIAAIRAFLPVVEEIGRLAHEEGVQAGLHPHLNTLIETPAEIDVAMAGLDPKKVSMVADVGHMYLAGGDPVAILKKYAKRLTYFHFKDGVRPVQRPSFEPSLRELGRGEVNFPAIMKLLKDSKYAGWINVELDASTHTPNDACEISFNYVNKNLKALYT